MRTVDILPLRAYGRRCTLGRQRVQPSGGVPCFRAASQCWESLPRGAARSSRAIHPRVVMAVAGDMAARLVIGLMRWRRPRRVAPGLTARAAFSMLPPDVQAAVTAALREEEDSIQALHAKQADRPGRARATPAAVPPYLFVVRSDKPGTFSSLRKLAWTRPDLLGVVFDRRWMGERRSQGQPERTGRRCAERRRPAPERSWTTAWFRARRARCALGDLFRRRA